MKTIKSDINLLFAKEVERRLINEARRLLFCRNPEDNFYLITRKAWYELKWNILYDLTQKIKAIILYY